MAMNIRDRIKELRRVRAGDLAPDPRNWRRHPKAQRDALAGVLHEIGYADALLARETPEGLCLIDGHLRAGLDPNQVVPVLVLDPFLGSGTTVIACEKLGRICYGMEIEPRYVQVTIERWQNYTGQKAVKVA